LISVYALIGDVLGRLICVLGTLAALASVAIYAFGPKLGRAEAELAEALLFVVFVVLIPGAFLFYLSRALRRFRRWARTVAICLLIPPVLASAFVVLVSLRNLTPGFFCGLPVLAVAGTLLCALASQDASVIFSDSYRQAVARSRALLDISDGSGTPKPSRDDARVSRWLIVTLIAVVSALVIVSGLAIVASMQ
jgi:hypothetical protein